MSKSASASLLTKQFLELTDPNKGMSAFQIELQNDNIYVWNVAVMVLNKESIYHGGYFKAEMKFPHDYPFSPPTFRFLRQFYHPNVYKDGRLCISILHPGEDESSGEAPSERWSPAQSVESVLVSIVSLLEDPNPDSPANVDAAVSWRSNREQYNMIAKRIVEASKSDIPEDFKIPDAEVYAVPAPEKKDIADDENFWYDDADDDDVFDEDLDDDEEDEDGDREGSDLVEDSDVNEKSS
ncbi:ubiquitin-conjugating enzyme and catalytic subunit of SCF ubiquitin-protein ligase [Limtongia smithiae]|uniref:ubiquitin-conjugating enzyme and catalytic subunit of SCF ubiquitin-protein ligase n=1 Tax=Limtongia smithiae TaxID=1125753 RepID=UPI0034CE25CA